VALFSPPASVAAETVAPTTFVASVIALPPGARRLRRDRENRGCDAIARLRQIGIGRSIEQGVERGQRCGEIAADIDLIAGCARGDEDNRFAANGSVELASGLAVNVTEPDAATAVFVVRLAVPSSQS
jgi:hypothetical protein